jgi:hypothetical protein
MSWKKREILSHSEPMSSLLCFFDGVCVFYIFIFLWCLLLLLLCFSLLCASLDCPFPIPYSVFSNVYLGICVCLMPHFSNISVISFVVVTIIG